MALQLFPSHDSKIIVEEDDSGTLVMVIPLQLPRFEFDWIVGFVQYVHKWLKYGKRIVLFPRPPVVDVDGWENVRRDGFHTVTKVLNGKPVCRHLILHYPKVADTFSGT
ncbi:hypothetical protein Aduo_009565 [Ancylostoma duodenale]